MNPALKGTALINLKLFLETKIGKQDTIKLLNEKIELWPETVLASTWYEADIYMRTEAELAKKLNKTEKEIIIESALHALKTDLNGVYKFFMKMGGVERVLGAGGSIAKTYMNFVIQETIENRSGHFKAHAIIPEKYADWYLAKTEGAFEGILNVFDRQKISFNFLGKRLFTDKGISYSDVTYELNY